MDVSVSQERSFVRRRCDGPPKIRVSLAVDIMAGANSQFLARRSCFSSTQLRPRNRPGAEAPITV
jgi:hypothetical protein